MSAIGVRRIEHSPQISLDGARIFTLGNQSGFREYDSNVELLGRSNRLKDSLVSKKRRCKARALKWDGRYTVATFSIVTVIWVTLL